MKPRDMIVEARRCVACGLCLPYCPTYRATHSEADSPRGRIHMISAVVQGTLPNSLRFAEHIDLCLSCRACENVCPNGVKYGALVNGARAQIAGKARRSWWRLVAQRAAAYTLSSRALTATVGRGLRLAQAIGLRRLARISPGVKKLEALLPTVPSQSGWLSCHEATSPRGEVSLFLGCVSSILDADTLHAAVFVLNRLGYTVHIPPQQACCGALHRGAGEQMLADAMAARNIEAFSVFAELPLLSVASGCGATLQEYMGRPLQDISAFLAQADGWKHVSIAPLNATILVHDSCTLRNVLRQQQSVYKLLQRIPGAKVLPLPGNDQCCGGAGAYMLTQEKMARHLRDDKIVACRQTGGSLLATSNIGCALHLVAGLREEGLVVEVMHPVQILARQMGFHGDTQG